MIAAAGCGGGGGDDQGKGSFFAVQGTNAAKAVVTVCVDHI